MKMANEEGCALEDDESTFLIAKKKTVTTKRNNTSWSRRFCSCTITIIIVFSLAYTGNQYFGNKHSYRNKKTKAGPYQLVERQEGAEFFDHYSFYEGEDSIGSNGYNDYISMEEAKSSGIINVTKSSTTASSVDSESDSDFESFVYMGSAPTDEGPRESVRLEGKRKFNKGLFIIDIRHMPVGCGVWPAFWLTDGPHWPKNGEIDIVEGVNYQSIAKTALHTTQGCVMDDNNNNNNGSNSAGVGRVGNKATGTWDTAVGVPDKDTGIPDPTLRYANDCFVYNPHQWLNQGCVAMDTGNNNHNGGSLGIPLNTKGGGVYALEWDPDNNRVRSWVFTPHAEVPDNLRDSMRTAHLPTERRIIPNTDTWPLPYGYYPTGDGTGCPGTYFRNMNLVFNLAFCGSVAGNRYHLDCPKQAKQFDTCNEWVDSEPDELREAYWKIRGVYVYERQ